MNRAVTVSIFLLWASGASFAQTTVAIRAQAPGQDQTQLVAVLPPASTCPVSLHAQQRGYFTRREVTGNSPGDTIQKDPGQTLNLTVTTSDSRQIVAANVTVRGLTGKARFTPVLSDSSHDTSDAAKTLNVRFSADSVEPSANLLLPGFTAVNMVELNSVTYGDGSTWRVAAGKVCHWPVDGLMPVDSR
jgi:hypothetical protein